MSEQVILILMYLHVIKHKWKGFPYVHTLSEILPFDWRGSDHSSLVFLYVQVSVVGCLCGWVSMWLCVVVCVCVVFHWSYYQSDFGQRAVTFHFVFLPEKFIKPASRWRRQQHHWCIKVADREWSISTPSTEWGELGEMAGSEGKEEWSEPQLHICN